MQFSWVLPRSKKWEGERMVVGAGIVTSAAATSCDVTYDKRFISSPDTVVLLSSISSIYQC